MLADSPLAAAVGYARNQRIARRAFSTRGGYRSQQPKRTRAAPPGDRAQELALRRHRRGRHRHRGAGARCLGTNSRAAGFFRAGSPPIPSGSRCSPSIAIPRLSPNAVVLPGQRRGSPNASGRTTGVRMRRSGSSVRASTGGNHFNVWLERGRALPEKSWASRSPARSPSAWPSRGQITAENVREITAPYAGGEGRRSGDV